MGKCVFLSGVGPSVAPDVGVHSGVAIGSDVEAEEEEDAQGGSWRKPAGQRQKKINVVFAGSIIFHSLTGSSVLLAEQKIGHILG